METGIYALLHGDATVSGLVKTRIYPENLPEGCAWPAILYQRPETQREPTMDTAGLPRATVKITCFGEMKTDVITLGNAVAEVLADYSGAADDTTILASLMVESAHDGWDYEKSTQGLYVREMTFQIFYRD